MGILGSNAYAYVAVSVSVKHAIANYYVLLRRLYVCETERS
jgi:hypothetical protein